MQVELAAAAARDTAAISKEFGNPGVDELIKGAEVFFQPPLDEVVIKSIIRRVDTFVINFII